MTEETQAPTKVFISYSWDSEDHKERVLALANTLREHWGIDTDIDRYVRAKPPFTPPQGWDLWMEKRIEWAEFVLIVCTETYQRRFRGDETPGIGRGSTWEGTIIRQHLYNSQLASTKFIPVVFSSQDLNHVPIILNGNDKYILEDEKSFTELCYRLRKEPIVVMSGMATAKLQIPPAPTFFSPQGSSDTIEVFISYSKQDKELRDGLLSHLRPLETKGIISWHDRQILPGTEWDAEIKARLNAADIILLLISADFLATDYCTQVEIPEALRRHEAGKATVIPVILRSCAWDLTPLAAIQAYPEKAKPIKSWPDIDEAYTDVVRGVYRAATTIQERRGQQQAEQERIQQEQQRIQQERQRQAKEQERLRQAEQLLIQQAAEAERLRRQELQERQEQAAEAERLRRQELQERQEQAQPVSPDVLRGNYAQLEALLKAGKWREADEETAKQMCQVMGRQNEGWLRIEDVDQFPCADLRAIDQLWVTHSKGKFGFSVQKKIWQQCGSPTEYGKQWEKFGEAVGWRSRGLMGIGAREEGKSYSSLVRAIATAPIYIATTPIHHLPFYFRAFLLSLLSREDV